MPIKEINMIDQVYQHAEKSWNKKKLRRKVNLLFILFFILFIYVVTHKTLYDMNKRC